MTEQQVDKQADQDDAADADGSVSPPSVVSANAGEGTRNPGNEKDDDQQSEQGHVSEARSNSEKMKGAMHDSVPDLSMYAANVAKKFKEYESAFAQAVGEPPSYLAHAALNLGRAIGDVRALIEHLTKAVIPPDTDTVEGSPKTLKDWFIAGYAGEVTMENRGE